MYLTQLYFSENTPNQILHVLITLILWSKLSTLLLANILPYTISGPSHPKKYLIGINVSQQMFNHENFLTYTTTTTTVLSGDVTSHA